MEFSKYSGLVLYEYAESYFWLCQYIGFLFKLIEEYKETGLQDYSQDYIHNLQTSLRANRDRADKLSEKLDWYPNSAVFEEFKLRLRHMPEDQRPIFPNPEVIDSVRVLLSAIWNRLNQQSNVLDRWPNVDVGAFTNELKLALRDLMDCRAIITEHDVCKGEGDVSSDHGETPENESIFSDEDDEADIDGFRDILTPSDLEDTGEDNLHVFLDLSPDASAAGFSAENAYKIAIDSMRSAKALLCECLAADQADLPDDSNPGRLLFDKCRKALTEAISSARSALEDCYTQSDAFEAWLAGTAANGAPPHLEPSTANFLLDAVAELSGACDALKDLEKGVSDSPEDLLDSLSNEPFDLYEELDRKFEELYGNANKPNAEKSDPKADSTGGTLFSQRLTQARDRISKVLAALGITD